MSDQEKLAVVEQILTRAAEGVGDITAPTMASFYQRFPEARSAFEQHGGANINKLEGEMVEQALYCLMCWFDSPAEIKILLAGSVPHHETVLDVQPEYYQGLLVAAAEVIQATIPSGNKEELLVWQLLSDDLAELILTS